MEDICISRIYAKHGARHVAKKKGRDTARALSLLSLSLAVCVKMRRIDAIARPTAGAPTRSQVVLRWRKRRMMTLGGVVSPVLRLLRHPINHIDEVNRGPRRTPTPPLQIRQIITGDDVLGQTKRAQFVLIPGDTRARRGTCSFPHETALRVERAVADPRNQLRRGRRIVAAATTLREIEYFRVDIAAHKRRDGRLRDR